MNPNSPSFFPPASQRPAAPAQPRFSAFPHAPPKPQSQGIGQTLSGLSGGLPMQAVKALAVGAGSPLHGHITGPLVMRDPTGQQIAQALFAGNPVLGKDAQ